VKKIFLSVDDGGYYERIFSIDMTAEKVIIAHQLKAFVDEFVRDFAAARRKFQTGDRAGYENVLGKELTSRHSDVIHQVMPQCALFVCGSIFRDLTELQKKDPSEITPILQKEGTRLVQTHLMHIIDYAKSNKDKADRSWPVLLKSNAFFNFVAAYVSGIRRGAESASS